MSAPAFALPGCDTGTATLERVLAALRGSLVDESVYEDLEDVLGPHAELDATRTAELAVRLRLALADVLPAARRAYGHQPLIARAVELRDRNQPGHPNDARRHLRVLALVTLDLLDILAPGGAPHAGSALSLTVDQGR
ncbi:hypothetical protein ACWD01_32820 [Streptomyces sp. NPDC002835]